jgi:Outer membrane protein beta-barrel domain
MDNNRKDIGRAIRNKLEDMQQQPQAGGWDKLRASLDEGKKKRGRLLWLWPLVLFIIAFTAGLAYFMWPLGKEGLGNGQVKKPAETTVTGTDNTDPGTDIPGGKNYNAGSPTTGSKNTTMPTAGVDSGAEGNGSTVNDANNTGANSADVNSTNATSAKAVTEANSINAKSRKATAAVNSIQSGSGKSATDASGKNSKAPQKNTAYNTTTNPPMPEGNAAPGQVSAPKKGREGSIAPTGSTTGTLAYGPDRMGAITTGADAAKERMAQANASNQPKGGAAGGTSNANALTAGQNTVAVARTTAKKSLVKPKKGASKTTATRGDNVAAHTAADDVRDAAGNVSDSVAARDTLTAAEAGTLMASTANIIFTATLEEYNTATVAQVTDSTAHELDEKIEGGATGDDKDKDKDNAFPYKRFYAFAYAAPNRLLYNSGRSLIDSRLNGLKTDTKTTVSYGAFLGYEATRRWGIRAGVLISRAERTTSGIVLDTVAGQQNYTGIKYIPGLNNNMLGDLFNRQPFSIIQKTELFEVPVEVTYRMGGNKWSGKLIGGFSVVHVRSNEVRVQGSGYNFALGSLANTKQTSFTAGFGAGLYYEVLPNLQINVEPFIKYYINTFGEGSYQKTFNDSNPFSLSVRVGLQYNFNLSKKKK